MYRTPSGKPNRFRYITNRGKARQETRRLAERRGEVPKLPLRGLHREQMREEEMLTHLSLCTGIGGIDLAAEWAGFTTVGQCEIDEYASKVLAKNFKGVPNLHDIRTVTASRLRENGIEPNDITVLSAGFPCQPYSLAGKGKGDGDERDLWGEVKRCIGEIKPRWFVGENTPGLFSRENQRYFRRILADLAALGYRVSWGIWGASDVGAPHKRERVFICGHRKNTNTACKRLDKDALQRRESAESRNAQNERRIQSGGMQSERVCGCVTDTTGNREKERWKKPNEFERCCWDWQIEPDVGRKFDGFSTLLDELGGISNEAKDRASEILRNLRKAVGAQEIQRTIGRHDKIQCSKILLSFLCEYAEDCYDSGVEIQGRAITQKQVRDMWERTKFACPPYRREYRQQYAREYSNALQQLSRKTSSSYAASWQDGSWESGIERVSINVSARVDRLRCLGNAVVPWQVLPLLEEIAEYEKEIEK